MLGFELTTLEHGSPPLTTRPRLVLKCTAKVLLDKLANQFFSFFRCLLVQINPEAEAAEPGYNASQHYLPDVRLPPCLRGVVLPQRGHLLYRKNRRLHSLQLRVSCSAALS